MTDQTEVAKSTNLWLCDAKKDDLHMIQRLRWELNFGTPQAGGEVGVYMEEKHHKIYAKQGRIRVG